MNEQKEHKIKLLKHQIEVEKIQLDRYIKTIVRSAFLENCTSGAYFNKLFNDEILNGIKQIRNSKKSIKVKNELLRELYPSFKEKNEIEILEDNLKYRKRLTGGAELMLTMLNNEQKEKIIMDGIEQQSLWSNQFDRNSKIFNKLEKKKK